MNTPAHVAINLVILARKKRSETIFPIVIGSILPDLPIIIFYLILKVFKKMPEGIIWSQAYYNRYWQSFFDLFNSFPILLAGLIISVRLQSSWLVAFFAGMMLHAFGDFPLHHNDAHRHLFPFSEWRFNSPISYWDPSHYGNIFGSLEVVAVIAASIGLLVRFKSPSHRMLVVFLLLTYGGYWIYVFWVWI